MVLRSFLASLLMVSAFHAASGEMLVSEDFEKFDLNKLGAGWGVLNSKGELALVEEPGHGKVLKIASKGGDFPNVSYVLDVSKIKGQTLRVSVACKFPGAYKPIADKTWARPKLQLHTKDKAGKDLPDFEETPRPNTPDWQVLQGTLVIDKDASFAQVFLRVDLVVAEVLFDNLSIEMMTSGAPANVAVAAGGGAAGPPPAGDANAGKAAKAPKKTIEDGGVLFSPELAASLQKNTRPGATPYSVLYVGSGLPMRELEKKPGSKWSLIPPAKEVSGPLATPRQLLAVLPEILHKSKPEVVFLIAEATPRKPASTEQYDWEDLARLCARMGAVPVLAMPGAQTGADTKEEMRNAMTAASLSAQCPLVEIKAPTVAFKRVVEVSTLLDKFVYCRVPVDDKPDTEEKE